MARRSGQNGWIELRNGVYYARFWLDVPGQTNRSCPRIRICPETGTGSLNSSERSRRLKQIIAERGVNSDIQFRLAETGNLDIGFEEQSKIWLQALQSRKRKPIKQRTAESWKSHLKYINSKIGQMQLRDVNNCSMKEFINQMASEQKLLNGGMQPRFSPKSIENYLAVIKSVVASRLNEKGEPVYEVKWDANFMDVPLVEDQNTPSFTAGEIETIISLATEPDAVLYSLLGGSGLRIGEAFALRIEDVEGSVLHVRHGSWDGKITSTKSDNGVRDVYLHSSLADLLNDHIGGREGLVFPSERGTPLRKSNVLRRSLHPILRKMGKQLCGFHAFRRYRAEHLEIALPGSDVLRKLWLGHSLYGVSEKYARNLKRNTMFQTMMAQQAGIGFQLRPIAPTHAPAKLLKEWSGREDLNLRPPGPEPGALPG